jgi:hypothetical protein
MEGFLSDAGTYITIFTGLFIREKPLLLMKTAVFHVAVTDTRFGTLLWPKGYEATPKNGRM